jgi:hypothetical protein
MDNAKSAVYGHGKALLRDAAKHGQTDVYSLTHDDTEILRACGFDPVPIGNGFYVCWEPVPDEEKGAPDA